jgi:DNA polymerase (family 10)
VHVAAPDEYGSVVHATTGSARHVAAIATRRRDAGPCAREEDVYAGAGLPFIPAEMRNGTGEVEAAADGTLPTVVELEQIRGDLHMHTTDSDGQDALETMVAAASGLGYEYIAITDHSARAGAARTVTADALARQRDDIGRMREQYPHLAILHGVEVDIMPDGTLDFDDDVLEPLDIVLASLHDSARQNGRMLTRRCIQAIRHPLVTVITHPANRLVGRRADYPLDFAAIFEAAAETGTALEIDGAPSHLDMDGEHAREAVAAGVTVVIDSDAHRSTALSRQMRFGVGTARRGWVQPGSVLNTRNVEDLRRFVAAKRRP